MPKAHANGIDLYYEITGSGFPVVLVHEFSGNMRNWDPQIPALSRSYQVIRYDCRGYGRSSVPPDPLAYSQDASVEDLHQLLLHLGIRQAYVGGLSMGGNIALNFGLKYPEMAKGLIIAATGSGSTNREEFRAGLERTATVLETQGTGAVIDGVMNAQTRVGYFQKNPEAAKRFREEYLSQSSVGIANTARGVLAKRPPIFELESKLVKLQVPALILVGDKDAPCLAPAHFMKEKIAHVELHLLPGIGHVINMEVPDLFNTTVLNFLDKVGSGKPIPSHPEDKYVMANGLRFHYLDWGNEGKQSMLLLHGVTSNAHSWDDVAEELRGRYQIIALDQRGHGDSEWSPTGAYTTEDHAADIAAFIEALGLRNIVLIGLSMGGRNAILYTPLHPETIDRLVIVDIGPDIDPRGSERIRQAIAGAPEEFDSLEEAAERARKLNPRPPLERHLARMKHSMKVLPNGKLTWKYDREIREQRRRGEIRVIDLWTPFKKITCPTLIVRGSESDVLSPEVARKMREAIPSAEIAVVEESGHSVSLDNPKGLERVVKEFLQRR
ncbi:MAG: alpha/beta fold hydrolase [Candidatus Tectomicrobia bacterium]|nr:alpha/beta fold hydrolase [Candidatus Tectomicrobia bacterium]